MHFSVVDFTEIVVGRFHDLHSSSKLADMTYAQLTPQQAISIAIMILDIIGTLSAFNRTSIR